MRIGIRDVRSQWVLLFLRARINHGHARDPMGVHSFKLTLPDAPRPGSKLTKQQYARGQE